MRDRSYRLQFEGEVKKLHDELNLTGRAVTAVFMPIKFDSMEAVRREGDTRGYKDTCSQRVADHLQEGDAVVAGMFDKAQNGTFVGGNLTVAINVRTRTGGAVIWGGVCDIEQMQKIDTQVYYRGTDPTLIRECLMIFYNGPVKIGKAVCMPGDIVMGTTSGILFIPAYLVEGLINNAEKPHAKDILGFAMLEQGIYTVAEIDNTVWPKEMVDKTINFIERDPSREKYRELDWSLEINAVRGNQKAADELMKGYLV